MSNSTEILVNTEAPLQSKVALKPVMLMLFARSGLFLLMQSCMFLVLLLINGNAEWKQSARFWPFVVTAANIICAILLSRLFRREGRSFWDLFRIQRGTVIKDALFCTLAMIVAMPFSYLPNILAQNIIFGNTTDAVALLFQPLPAWAVWVAIVVFPLTMPIGELTNYFGYVMPRLERLTRSKVLALCLPAVMLALQHVFLPLIPDWRFMLWRGVMFLPFAFMVGLLIRWKPHWLPYLLIGHVLIDIMAAASYFMLPM